MLSENDFIGFALMDKRGVWLFVNEKITELGHSYGVEWLMRFRRNMQKSLYKYSRKHKYDAIQANAIMVNELISKWCLDWFRPWARNEFIRANPNLAKSPLALKRLVIDACERFVRDRSY